MIDTNAKLRGWMAERKMSYAVFAEKVGIPYDTFKVKMSGKTDWKLSEVFKILRFTGCAFEELF